MRFRDVVDQLHDDDGLADAGAAEQADLAALGIGRQQIHHLDAGDQHLGLRRLVDEFRRRTVDRIGLLRIDGAALIHRLADHINDAAQRLRADRHGDRRTGVGRLLAAHQAIGRIHGDSSNGSLPQVLRHFQHQGLALILHMERVQDRRQIAFELHVHDGAQDLGDLADYVLRHNNRSFQ